MAEDLVIYALGIVALTGLATWANPLYIFRKKKKVRIIPPLYSAPKGVYDEESRDILIRNVMCKCSEDEEECDWCFTQRILSN